MTPIVSALLGALGALAALIVLGRVLPRFWVEVVEGEAVLVWRGPLLLALLSRPGWHFMPAAALPSSSLQRASLRWDFRCYEGIAVCDHSGQETVVDLRLEVQVEDPGTALLEVGSWEDRLRDQALVTVRRLLEGWDRAGIIGHAEQLGRLLEVELAREAKSLGINVRRALLNAGFQAGGGAPVRSPMPLNTPVPEPAQERVPAWKN